MQILGQCAVKTVVNFTGIVQAVTLQPTDINAIELVFLQREAAIGRVSRSKRTILLLKILSAAGTSAAQQFHFDCAVHTALTSGGPAGIHYAFHNHRNVDGFERRHSHCPRIGRLPVVSAVNTERESSP
jgi:hypothetical protein